MATFDTKMIKVEMKSRNASTNDATSETDDDERTASPLARSKTMLTPKLTVGIESVQVARRLSRNPPTVERQRIPLLSLLFSLLRGRQ
jgi:hypothetical protein